MFTWRGSALQETWKPLLGLFVVSALLTWFYEDWGLGRFSLTQTPFTLVGLALSIFLGFRNNACYDRWWEARRLWGGLINTTRSLARQILTLPKAPEADAEALRALQERFVYGVIGFAVSLKLHLRAEGSFNDLQTLLPRPLWESLLRERNAPNAVSHWLGVQVQEAAAQGWIHPIHQDTLERGLTELTNIQGACERIKNTPVPLTYTVLTHQIVFVYCLLLPLGIMSTVGTMTPFVVLIVAFAFLGLDEVGTQIEDPFKTDTNDLPLDALCRVIEVSLKQRLGETDLPPDTKPINGVLY
jgi:putative membrane protein